MPYLTVQKDGSILIHVYVQPRASRTELVGMHDGCLKLAISSPPVDDRANKSVITFLADFLQVSPKLISLSTGRKSRRKKLRINTLGVEEIRRRVDAHLTNCGM